MRLHAVLVGALVAALASVATPAAAVTIDGHLGFSGHVIYDTLDTSGHAGLDFFDEHAAPPGPLNPNGPVVEVDAVTVGSYMNVVMGISPFVTSARILNVTNDPGAVGIGYTYAPDGTTGAPFPINNFLSNFVGGLPALAGLHFDMTEFPDLSGNPCPNNPCVEGPFSLSEITDLSGKATGVRIDFTVIGKFIANGGKDSGDYTGSFDVTINGLTLAEAGKRLTSTGDDILCGPNNAQDACGFHGNFDPISTVPEPATMLTFGLGSLALARFRRRKA